MIQETIDAFEAGARHMTHLFNAMPPIHHREPGPIIAALANNEVTVALIPDGIHVHPGLVRKMNRTNAAVAAMDPPVSNAQNRRLACMSELEGSLDARFVML